jgi:hypothetical protein
MNEWKMGYNSYFSCNSPCVLIVRFKPLKPKDKNRIAKICYVTYVWSGRLGVDNNYII